MNGRDFLSLAHLLAGLTTEAAWRSAVSRAYYAAFHVARELLESLGFTVPRADRAHGYLWLRLQNCGDPVIEGAGSELNTLRRLRNEADYNFGTRYSVTATLTNVQIGEKVIRALAAANVGPTRIQITDAMKIYERDVLHDITWHP